MQKFKRMIKIENSKGISRDCDRLISNSLHSQLRLIFYSAASKLCILDRVCVKTLGGSHKILWIASLRTLWS